MSGNTWKFYPAGETHLSTEDQPSDQWLVRDRGVEIKNN